MNQLCKVCGEPAAGFHFGAFTCEGCKSFFGRTYNNISAIASCKNNGDCVINKKNRTACKACRLRKCLLVGMSKSGSRYGRRSNWFKIHCLLQEQQTHQATGGATGGMDDGGPGGSFEQLARLHQMHVRQTYQDKTNPWIKTVSLPPAMALSSALSQKSKLSSNINASVANQPIDFLTAIKLSHNNGNDHMNAKLNPSVSNMDGQGSFKSNSSRVSNTPSDSDASSAAEPKYDFSSGNKECNQQQLPSQINERNCNSANTAELRLNDTDEECDRRRQQLLQIFRSHSEPLTRPFAPFPISNLPPPIQVGAPPTKIPPAFKEEINRLTSTAALVLSDTAQEEPIDLSLKPRQTNQLRSSTVAGQVSSSPLTDVQEAVNVIPKTTPLDLTSVHSQRTLTG